MRLNRVYKNGMQSPSQEYGTLFKNDVKINEEGVLAKKSDPEPDFYLARPRYQYNSIVNQVAQYKTREIWDKRFGRLQSFHTFEPANQNRRWAGMNAEIADEFSTDSGSYKSQVGNSIYNRNGAHGLVDFNFDIRMRRFDSGEMTVDGVRRLRNAEHGGIQPKWPQLSKIFRREIHRMYQ